MKKTESLPVDPVSGVPLHLIVTEPGQFFIRKKGDARKLLKKCPWKNARLKAIVISKEQDMDKPGYCIILPGGLIYCIGENGLPYAFRPPKTPQPKEPEMEPSCKACNDAGCPACDPILAAESRMPEATFPAPEEIKQSDLPPLGE